MCQETIFDRERNQRRKAHSLAVIVMGLAAAAVGLAGILTHMPGFAAWVMLVIGAGFVSLMAGIVAHNAHAYEIRPDLTSVKP